LQGKKRGIEFRISNEKLRMKKRVFFGRSSFFIRNSSFEIQSPVPLEYPFFLRPFGLLSALGFDRASGGPYTRRFLFRGLEE
jgi:hypothetical protein